MRFYLCLAVLLAACCILPAAAQTDWDSCSLFTSGASSSLSAECTVFTLPGDYLTNQGTIDVFVKRVQGSNNDGRTRQLWMVSDGPGLSGQQFEDQVTNLMADTNGAFDIYLMDHRGTGRSSPLNCPVDTALGFEGPEGDCISHLQSTYGDDMYYYQTENVAQDYVSIIETLSSEAYGLGYQQDTAVALYGAGYGAYVINQVLTFRPALADAVVFDSYQAPPLAERDILADGVGLDFVAECMLVSGCRDLLRGADARSLVENLFEHYDDLDCPHIIGLEADDMQRILRNFLQSEELRPFVLPVVARTVRCNSDDVDFLLNGLPGTFTDFFFENNDPSVTGESFVFRNMVDLNEYLRFDTADVPDITSLTETSEGLRFSNFAPTNAAGLYDTWPWRQFNNVNPLSFSVATVPALLLGAQYDAVADPSHTSLAAESYNGGDQRFIEVPFSIHNVLLNSRTNDGNVCGFDMIVEFLNSGVPDGDFDPFAASNLCLADLVKPDYEAVLDTTQDLSEDVFGTRDVWGIGDIPTFDDDDDSLSLPSVSNASPNSPGSPVSPNSPASPNSPVSPNSPASPNSFSGNSPDDSPASPVEYYTLPSSGASPASLSLSPVSFIGFSSGTLSYFTFGFSSDDLPALPNLSLSTIIIFDTKEDSSRTPYEPLSLSLETGILPPASDFGPNGTFLGAASGLSAAYACVVCVVSSLLLLL